jgi:hypothetical protein
MGPIDYMSQYPQFDLAQKFTSGLQAGAAVGQLDQQQAAQQAAQQQAQQYKTDVAAAMASPTPQNFSALALKYPAQREAIKQSWDGLSAGDQKAEGDTMAQAYAALLAGDVDAAKKVVQDQIAARKNSGLDTSHYDNALGLLNADPKQAQGALGFALSHISDPKTFAQSFGTLQELPGKVADGEAGAAGKQADNAAKNNALVGQTLGSLQGKGAKPAQAVTAIKSLQARGALLPADAQSMIDSVPTDPKALDDWFGQQRAAGMKPDDQQKYLTPDANTLANNATSIKTTGMNNAAQLAVQDKISERENSGGDAADFTPDAIDNAAKRYNLDGTLPPMGMGAAASAGRTKILNRAAELAAGIDGTDQRRNQLTTKQGIANQGKAVAAFNTGKEGKAVRSFNVLLSHLDTLDSLSDALNNGNYQLVNKLGNSYNKATGNPAPTNFDSVKHIVADEVVKAITGGAGALGDREESAKAINGANSPAQLKGVIQNIKQLSVGQLGGLEQQYKASTGLDDFEHYLTPAARLMRAQHSEVARGAPGGSKVVNFGDLK